MHCVDLDRWELISLPSYKAKMRKPHWNNVLQLRYLQGTQQIKSVNIQVACLFDKIDGSNIWQLGACSVVQALKSVRFSCSQNLKVHVWCFLQNNDSFRNNIEPFFPIFAFSLQQWYWGSRRLTKDTFIFWWEFLLHLSSVRGFSATGFVFIEWFYYKWDTSLCETERWLSLEYASSHLVSFTLSCNAKGVIQHIIPFFSPCAML